MMDDPVRTPQVREEMADVFAYLLRLPDLFDLDLEQALVEKSETNDRKYPAHLARGRADKFTQLGG
ncbi:hypothetical protein [Streptomyces sp. 2A115]|uniref:hypothetical protein n=1 Tax=Streptomyces sp. 2A115 TaxID=3457439 RepID=UPI003FD2F416